MIDQVIGFPGHITVHRSDRGEYVVGIDATYGGQTSLSTLGTILVGNWRAAIIESAFGGTGVDNGKFTISIAGDFCATGAITLEVPEEGSIVSLPSRGRVVNRSETLDPEQNLKDVASISQAYDNISPVAAKGDLVVFDGETSWPLPLGKDGMWLKVASNRVLGIEWSKLPSFYSTVYSYKGELPQREVLGFVGEGLYVRDNFERTEISLHRNLNALAKVGAAGILTYTPRFDSHEEPLETRTLREGNGIEIWDGDGEGDPVIGIDQHYKGQYSIEVLGHVKDGYWGATTVDPEFGGTGYANQHGISLGGEMATSCLVTIGDPDLKTQYIVLNAKGDTRVTLPQSGTIATEEGSLQVRHNLKDIANPKEAFRHISPTKDRGDLIVKGWGDYDTVVPIGAAGQVLTVDPDQPGLVDWVDPLTIEDVFSVVEDQIEIAIEELHEANKPQPNTLAGMPIENVLEAILMQLDHMKNLGILQPIAEMKTVLAKWTAAKHK